MDKFFKNVMEEFKQFRIKHLSGIGKICLKLKISANMITSLSLLLGLISIYYLFSNQLLFIIFAILHLFTDGLDGVVAHLSRTTKFGEFFDRIIADRVVELAILLKIGWYFNEYYAYVVAGLFVLAQIISVLSKYQAPILYTRTILLILGAFSLGTIAYLVTGVAAVYSLARQLQWFMSKKKFI